MITCIPNISLIPSFCMLKALLTCRDNQTLGLNGCWEALMLKAVFSSEYEATFSVSDNLVESVNDGWNELKKVFSLSSSNTSLPLSGGLYKSAVITEVDITIHCEEPSSVNPGAHDNYLLSYDLICKFNTDSNAQGLMIVTRVDGELTPE